MTHLPALLGQHFAYASGRTGVLQQILLTASDRDRLLGAKDLRETEAMLTELKFTDPIDQGLKKSDDILAALLRFVRREVEMMTPKAKLPTFSILWLAGDAPLIAYLLKKRHGLTSVESLPPLSGASSYPLGSLDALITEGKPSILPLHLQSFIKNIIARKSLTPQMIDASVSQYIAGVQLSLAQVSGSALIRRFVRNTIDLKNIRTALRVKNAPDAIDHLIQGGNIDPKSLVGDAKRLQAAIDRSPLAYALSDAVRSASDDANALEIALSKVTANDIADMWNIPLSIEPVFAFAALAQSQIMLLRAIVIGKRAGLSPQEIKQMLPPFIPASHYMSL